MVFGCFWGVLEVFRAILFENKIFSENCFSGPGDQPGPAQPGREKIENKIEFLFLELLARPARPGIPLLVVRYGGWKSC